MSDEQKLLAACGDYRAKLDKLEAENTALWADRDRLDWLSCHPGIIKHYDENWYWAGEEIATFRAAIDAARKEAQP